MAREHMALIGCGLMGGSFALAAKRAGLVQRVSGFSRSPQSAERALELGIVDRVAPSALACVQGADLVLIAVPVSATQATLEALLPGLERHALVMDVGSTKQDVAQAAQAALGDRAGQFMPAHPICGKEVAGIAHADAGLYQDQQVILTPLPCHAPADIEQASAVWSALGCRVRQMPADQHDRALAAVSHFPHMMAFALMRSLMAQPEGEQFLAVAGPGFRDTTRIAGGDPDLWADVLLANAHEVIAQSRGLHEQLLELESMLQRKDRPAVRDFIARASARRAVWRLGGPGAACNEETSA
jgi:prephenate dehydrogenase